MQILTITVSEAGYYLNGAGDLDVDHSVIQSEMNGEGQSSIFAYLANGLEARRLAGTGLPHTHTINEFGKPVAGDFLEPTTKAGLA